MTDPTTTNILLAVPTRGSDPGTWDVPVNSNSLEIDGFFGGVQVVAVASSPITLTAPAGVVTAGAGPFQSTNAVLRFTGTLTSGVQITLPMPGYFIIENLTTGAFVLSFRALGAGEVIGIEQGVQQHIYNDGTNVRFVNLPTVGSYLDICDAAVPAWITACTKPPFLNCDGTTFSIVTYPYLNSKLGGNTLPDFRGVVPAYLNQGTSRITSAGSGLDGNTRFSIKTTQTYTLIVGNLPPYTPSIASQTLSGGNMVSGGGANAASGVSVAAAQNITTLALSQTFNPQGGTSTPFGIVGPTTIGGIRLIRAA